MKIDNNRAFVAEKKNYITPSTESMAFRAGSICSGSGRSHVGTNIPGLGIGGSQSLGIPD